jgi:hypothetical protein
MTFDSKYNSIAWNFVQIVLLLLSTIQLFINFYYFSINMPRKIKHLGPVYKSEIKFIVIKCQIN